MSSLCAFPLQCVAVHEIRTEISEVNLKLTKLCSFMELLFQSNLNDNIRLNATNSSEAVANELSAGRNHNNESSLPNGWNRVNDSSSGPNHNHESSLPNGWNRVNDSSSDPNHKNESLPNGWNQANESSFRISNNSIDWNLHNESTTAESSSAVDHKESSVVIKEEVLTSVDPECSNDVQLNGLNVAHTVNTVVAASSNFGFERFLASKSAPLAIVKKRKRRKTVSIPKKNSNANLCLTSSFKGKLKLTNKASNTRYCTVCCKNLSSYWQSHIASVHLRIPTLYCNLCDYKAMWQRSHMQQHFVSTHPNHLLNYTDRKAEVREQIEKIGNEIIIEEPRADQ